MNKEELVKIARAILKKDKIDKKLAAELIKNLKRQDLSMFQRVMQRLYNQKTVKVISQEPLSQALKKSLTARFADKEVVFENEEIGDGIKIINNDTIIDLTIENYVDNTIQSLKN